MSGVQLEKWINKTNGELPAWIKTNRYTIGTYLGRVNFVSIPASLLLLLGSLYTFPIIYQFIRHPDIPGSQALGFIGLTTFFTIAGYLMFILIYPISADGDILKATYLMQVYPLIAIQTAALLEKVRPRWVIYLLAAGLVLTALFDLQAMFTHYIDIPDKILSLLRIN